MQLQPKAADSTQLHVRAFCASITHGKAVSVLQMPEAGAKPLQCFDNVRAKVEVGGGRAVMGWALWEIPGLFIEAEHHAVWESPDGTLIDPSPQREGVIGMTFLPDASATEEGQRRDNIRKPLTDNRLVHDFLRAAQARYKLMYTGSRAAQYGQVQLTDEEAKLAQVFEVSRSVTMTMLERDGTADSPCGCDSNRPYARCCAKVAAEISRYLGRKGF
jgi:hypothetical protein